jgi:hypothetical protein
MNTQLSALLAPYALAGVFPFVLDPFHDSPRPIAYFLRIVMGL